MADFLALVLGDRPGKLAVAFGRRPYFDGKGRYTHRDWAQSSFRWPDELEAFLDAVRQELSSGDPVDVYVCPYVRHAGAKGRRKGDALPPMVCHIDLDGSPADAAVWDTLNPLVVLSGQNGHRHAYVPLTRPVSLPEHRTLQEALRDRLDGDDKIADNDVLRWPGSVNHKPATAPNTGEPAPVTLELGEPTVWDPADLAAMLGVELGAMSDSSRHAPGASATEPVDLAELPAWLRKRLADTDPEDRSDAFHGLVGACKDAGLTQGQTVTVMGTWRPGVDKYGARLGDEVARCWPKLTKKVSTIGTKKVSAVSDKPKPAPVTLAECHAVFRRWLGDEYDLDVLDVMLCALAVERLAGDPLWLLIISGPGAAKTETAQACAGAGALVESTITGEAALLSGTPKPERAKNATGGLLRRLGDSGVLIVKDVTSIISMSRDRRAEVLAALREIHDGYWSRSIGAEGGLTLTWKGRLVVIGAVTTAWDTAHAVISAMGDRFVSIRLDSAGKTSRTAAYRRTMANTGDEVAMRAEMAAAVGGVIAGLGDEADLTLTEEEVERIGEAANIVTLARTGVEYDYKGDVIDAHAPEMPTRFARQLQQIVRGGMALGIDRTRALELAIRAARDSMPPVRLAIVDDLGANPHSRAGDIRRRVNLPWRTVDRQCQALYMLGVISCEEVAVGNTSHWYYSLAEGIDPQALKPSPDLATPTPRTPEERASEDTTEAPLNGGVANSGDVRPQVGGLWGEFDPDTQGALAQEGQPR